MASPPVELVATLKERYSFGPEIGRGGMATVFLAEDLRHHRKVAVKVLDPMIAATMGKDRFLREIEITAGLTHPNILPIHDSGEAGGFLYYVMPYVEGPNLRGLMDAGGLPVDQSVRIVSELAGALDYAHRLGVVHRDIKPENVLMLAGLPVLSDFGVARAVHLATGGRLTGDHMAMGTPGYMSPEQASGQAGVDGRSDIYALGCVLHELLFGELPVLAHLIGEKRSSRSRMRRPGIPTSVSLALTRALEPDPDARLATAGEFARGLRGNQVRLRPIVLGASAVAAAVILLMVLSLVWNRSGGPAAGEVQRVAVGQFTNRTGDPALDYLGIMAADWLTEGVLRTGIIQAVPTPTALHAFRAAERVPDAAQGPIRRFAEATGATLVVSGAYYRFQEGLQFQVQLTDVRSGRLLGALEPTTTSVRLATRAIEEMRARLMGLLASRLDRRLEEWVGRETRAPTFEAYRAYSEGIDEYLTSQWSAAARLFERSFELDSTFAPPLILASISWSNLNQYRRADQVLEQLAASGRNLPPHYQQWYLYRRALLDGKRSEALEAIRRLAAATPGTKATYNLAVEALQNGHLGEARQALLSLSPDRGPMTDWLPYWDLLGSVQHLLKRFEEERRTGVDARLAHPDRVYVLRSEVRALAALGEFGRLRQTLAEAERLPLDPMGPSPGTLELEAGLELAAHGELATARPFLERAIHGNEKGSTLFAANREDSISFAQGLVLMKEWSEARRMADAFLVADSTDGTAWGLLGSIAVGQGDSGQARKIMGNLERLPRRYSFGSVSVAEARIAARLGESAAAIALLRRGFAEGVAYDLWLHRDPDLSALRDHSAFQDLLKPRP